MKYDTKYVAPGAQFRHNLTISTLIPNCKWGSSVQDVHVPWQRTCMAASDLQSGCDHSASTASQAVISSCFHAHAYAWHWPSHSANAQWVLLGTSLLNRSGFLVIGENPLTAIHSLIAARLYVNPSDAMTGSTATACDSQHHQTSSAKLKCYPRSVLMKRSS